MSHHGLSGISAIRRHCSSAGTTRNAFRYCKHTHANDIPRVSIMEDSHNRQPRGTSTYSPARRHFGDQKVAQQPGREHANRETQLVVRRDLTADVRRRNLIQQDRYRVCDDTRANSAIGNERIQVSNHTNSIMTRFTTASTYPMQNRPAKIAFLLVANAHTMPPTM